MDAHQVIIEVAEADAGQIQQIEPRIRGVDGSGSMSENVRIV